MKPEPLLSDAVVSEFSDEIARLEKIPPASYRHCLRRVSRFVGHVSYALERGVHLPSSPLSLAEVSEHDRETYRDALPKLEAAKILLERHEEADGQRRYLTLEDPARLYRLAEQFYRQYPDEMRSLVQNLRGPERLFVVRKLWKPGIFNSRDLSEFMSLPPNFQSYDLKRLMTLGVIEKKLRGTYIPGPNAQLAMQIFAVMLLLWRRTVDSYLNLKIRQVQMPITYVLSSAKTLPEIVENVPDLDGLPDTEPIVVHYSKAPHYIEAASLRKAHLWGVDNYMDRVSDEVAIPYRLSALFKRVRTVSPDITIKQAESELRFGADPIGFSSDECRLWYFERPVF
jgi:hypothetical protein